MFNKYSYAFILSISLMLASFNSVNARPFNTTYYVSDGDKTIFEQHYKPARGMPYIIRHRSGAYELYNANHEKLPDSPSMVLAPRIFLDPQLHKLQKKAQQQQRQLNVPNKAPKIVPVKLNPLVEKFKFNAQKFLPPNYNRQILKFGPPKREGYDDKVMIYTRNRIYQWKDFAFHNQVYLAYNRNEKAYVLMKNGFEFQRFEYYGSAIDALAAVRKEEVR